MIIISRPSGPPVGSEIRGNIINMPEEGRHIRWTGKDGSPIEIVDFNISAKISVLVLLTL